MRAARSNVGSREKLDSSRAGILIVFGRWSFETSESSDKLDYFSP